MATLVQVAKILMALSPAYHNAPALDEPNYNTYHHFLEDLPVELLTMAAESLGGTSKFFPVASELRDEALRLQEEASGVLGPCEAWAEVERSFATHGLYKGAPEWSHPLIGETIKTVGTYADLCRSANRFADRAHFLRAYEELLQKYRRQQRLLPHIREQLKQLTSGQFSPPEETNS